ncbi:hypothetical protein F4776DRAFT_645091 [Hypoxylon sp. NC0597]|nr:hypothetical protein F4776DRAFT_645091 [Hypoxylon sp. NC0597]
MHHFQFTNDRYGDLARGHPLQTQLLKITPVSLPDKSAWRARNKASKLDIFSWDVMKKFLKGESTKLLYPLHPVPTMRADKSGNAVVHLDNDMICIRFAGMIIGTWIRPLAVPGMLDGIKRVALEYKKQAPGCPPRFPRNAFRCRCPDLVHRSDHYCPTAIDHFITYFPDLEKLYFIVKVNRTGSIIPPPPLPLPPHGKKRDYEGNVKVNVPQPTKRRLTRVAAAKKLYSDTVENFKGKFLLRIPRGQGKPLRFISIMTLY